MKVPGWFCLGKKTFFRQVGHAIAALLALSLGMDAAFGQAADSPKFKLDSPRGHYAVGLRVTEQYDYSRIYRPATDALGRSYNGERARPLQTLIWYPAKSTHDLAMTVGGYVDLLPTETSFGQPKEPTGFDGWDLWSEAIGGSLATPMQAKRNAVAVSERFPLVIYAPGLSGTSWENADWCEYLASFGYVVIASPSIGVSSRPMTADLAGANAQAQDISFLIGYARSLPNVDLSRVAVAGFSWGGMASSFAAARDGRINAVISFDGSTRYFPSIVQQAGDVFPDQMTVPLLFFKQRDYSLELQDRNAQDVDKVAPNFLNEWTHGDLIGVHVLGVAHTMLTSMYQRSQDKWWEYLHLRPSIQDDYGPEDASVGYAWVARYSLQFLDAYLKHDPAAVAYLKRSPIENGAPPHVLAVEFRGAEGHPASFEAFRTEVTHKMFEHISDIYASFKIEAPNFKPDQAAVDAWANELIGDRHLDKAIVLLEFNAAIYPDSSAVYLSLGDAYLRAGRRQMAIATYKRAIVKQVKGYLDVVAARKLERLGEH